MPRLLKEYYSESVVSLSSNIDNVFDVTEKKLKDIIIIFFIDH